MANEPAYWNPLSFISHANPTDRVHDTVDTRKLRKLVGGRAGIELATIGPQYPTGRGLFNELKAWIETNCTQHPYTSAKREATRMAWARADIRTSDNAAHVLSAAFRLKEGADGYPPVPAADRIVVDRIVVVKNQLRWNAYDARRQALAPHHAQISDRFQDVAALMKSGTYVAPGRRFAAYPVIDANLGEVLLYHGTDATFHIVDTGVDPSRGRNKGTPGNPNYGLLGQGAYFSDQIAKSATYTLCRLCRGYKCNCTNKAGNPVLRKALLCRVLLGRVHFAPTMSVVRDREGLRSQTYQTAIRNGSHSIVAAGSGYRKAAGTNEFAVRRIDQIYPEFIIYWHHPAPLHRYNGLWDNASRIAMAKVVQTRLQKQAQYQQELQDIDDEQTGLDITALFS